MTASMTDTGNAAQTGQVGQEAAETYERFFVPALFAQWTQPMLDAADVTGEAARILDVGCGTGVLARAAAARLGSAGSTAGVDPNEAMLAVARRTAPTITWHTGRAEALPWNDASFDVVLCQFGLMFFEDREAGLREMVRVLKPGGRLAVAVWASLDRSPGFEDLVQLLERLCGRPAADALRVPFSLGDTGQLAALFRRAGVAGARIETRQGSARFPSLPGWIHTNVRGWAFSDLVDDRQLDALIDEAQRSMARHVDATGAVGFSAPAHLVSARRP
ncbi:MAG TPA: methyltransferase domain-containing protein [Zeimonas sp.]|nr:methyltransferase domain-containing protein [Zeimonas sp.]